MASSRGSTASSKPPKQRLAVTAQSATSKPWFTCSQPNSISCFQTEIVATHAKQRRTGKPLRACQSDAIPTVGAVEVPLRPQRPQLIFEIADHLRQLEGLCR